VSHTPGPWKWELDCWALHNSKGENVLYPSTSYGDPTIRVSDDNARLIAAAPDLLAACEALMGYFKSGNDVPVDRATLTCMCDTVVLASAAIKKAKGQ
jgi:hypothetical protein